ncbi:hypothetical protein BJ878DRAFT_505644 [Calycina marina]|uniref:Uncharacterized protein n=1 Tax=Calycina marina TaxID=1763456 RepID=A0A9P7Z385_9HELO|nr:hypothetical protein BJ878DRAFT_505644 [Calycina marina]
MNRRIRNVSRCTSWHDTYSIQLKPCLPQQTLKSILDTYDTILTSALVGTSSIANLKAELEQQARLLKYISSRSVAMGERSTNEIDSFCNSILTFTSTHTGDRELINIKAFNLVAQYQFRSAVEISMNTATDSAAMKATSVLGLVFLPGTFISLLFSTTFLILILAPTTRRNDGKYLRNFGSISQSPFPLLSSPYHVGSDGQILF